MPAATLRAADQLAWLDAYNIVWTDQSRNAGESMPCGGHSIGLNVWVENGELLFYMQRSGCFDENNEYLKLGRVRVRLEPNPFAGQGSFRQELKLREGLVEISGKNGAVRAAMTLWVEAERPVVHLEIDANQPVTVHAAYENWRQADEILPAKPSKGARFGCISWEEYPGEVTRRRDTVSHEGDTVLFYHRNRDDALLFDYIVRQQGLEKVKDQLVNTQKGRTFGGVLRGEGYIADGTAVGRYLLTPFTAWRLRSTRPARRHHLEVFTHVAQTESLQAWRDALTKLVESQTPSRDEARRTTAAWWSEFWQRSRIVIAPRAGSQAGPDENLSLPKVRDDHGGGNERPWQIARNYQLFRYQLGCNARGEYPTKFNGGNFTFDPSLVSRNRTYSPDWRAWGGVLTGQNQRLVHWPMLKSGDADLMLPQLEFYRRTLPNAVARVRTYWGHDGCLFTEQTENFGLPMACAWGWTEADATARQRGQEIPFGDPRADGAQSYAAVVEHGVQANGAVAYHWESQLEYSFMMLEYHRFFGADFSSPMAGNGGLGDSSSPMAGNAAIGDIRPYLPMIRQSVRFFDEHYQAYERLRSSRPLDENGRLVIYPSTCLESYRGARNPADLIAGLAACLEALLALDDGLVPVAEKEYYRAYLKRLPAYTYATVDGDRILQPAESLKRYQNVECPQFYPLFPFDRFALGRDHMDVFRNTWKHGKFAKNMVQSWHQDGIFFARMGLTAAAADYNTRKLENSPRRFPTFWGPGHDWAPDHNWGGSGMIGLQEMLMQTADRRIVLLPAWPADWDCDFKLHAPYQTIVEGQVRNGKVARLIVTPASRRKDVVVADGSGIAK